MSDTAEDLLKEVESFIARQRSQAELNRQRGCYCSASTRDAVADALEKKLFIWTTWVDENKKPA